MSMHSLGELLERMHTAWDRLESARGTLRLWHDPVRTQAAWESWRRAAPSGSIQVPTAVAAREAEAATGAIRTDYLHFWVAKPWHWRVERSREASQHATTRPDEVTVIDGSVWWQWSAGHDVYTNARAPHPNQARGNGVDHALAIMLDPALLSGTLRMQVAGTGDELGRAAVAVDATTRDPQRDPGLWPGADRYTLMVDEESGVLLKAEAWQGTAAYAGAAFTDLTLGGQSPDERFVFQPPPNTPVHYLPEDRPTLDNRHRRVRRGRP